MTDARLARPSWRGRANVDALTISCIERAEKMSGHEFVVTQGSYQSGHGDENSAGTHDLGGVVDLRWCGHGDCILALRNAGMAAWHRTPRQGPWPDHIHAVVIDHPRLAPAAERQVISYLHGGNGLANNGADDGPRPDPIRRPVWPWPPVKRRPEPVRKAIKATKDALVGAGPIRARRIREALRSLRKIKKR